MAATLAAALIGCSGEVEEPSASVGEAARTTPPPAEQTRSQDSRPSVVLIVIDTLRADAVSAFGSVSGTTPTLDRLTREGVHYSRAYAPSPWTAPSHATLFSGLRVDEHGVGLAGRFSVPGSVRMLAEDFQDAGYVTAGFSQNGVVSRFFGFERGFDVLVTPEVGTDPTAFDLPVQVRRWNRSRDRSRPFFLFINSLLAHDPYRVRIDNPWLPAKVSREEAEFIQSRYPILLSNCAAAPPKNHLEILRGLYYGNVAAADAQLAEILEVLDEDGDLDSYLMVTTSDHGEHLGENRLMGHRFSVGDPVLHIPMIVSGLPETAPSVVDRPVELREVRQSLHCWALGEGCPADLPVADRLESLPFELVEPIFAIFSDSVMGLPTSLIEEFSVSNPEALVPKSRTKCGEKDRVFGNMVSMIRYPMKMTWFEKYAPVLHDLSWDARERFDQMEHQPELATALRSELEAFVREHLLDAPARGVPALSDEEARTLEALGYVE
jgi:hypothetical protein